MDPEEAAVIGAGPWGSTLAKLLHENHHTVSLWAYQGILTKGFKPPEQVEVSQDLEQVINSSKTLILATNSKHIVTTLEGFPHINSDTRILVATKGIVSFEKQLLLPYEAV